MDRQQPASVVSASRIVIIGAGQAGSALAVKLRALGHRGPITLIGEEPEPPYERPPLSKAYLLGKIDRARLFLRPRAFYAEQRIDLLTACRVEAIDRDRKAVRAGGKWHDYDLLALATGALPRRLPTTDGRDLPGIFLMRTIADVDAMAAACRRGGCALVVGGGYIGLEAAAVLRTLGFHVTLVEMGQRILQRVAAPQTSDYFRELHQAQGVAIRERCGVAELIGSDRLTGARLTDGSQLDVDLAVVGIGVGPDVGLAGAAGLQVHDGIAVDARGRTSDPAIWAAGDCASFPFQGRRIRLESVQNAVEQAETVAANMLGAERDYLPVPWFWSDQYHVKLQIAGINNGYDQVIVRQGSKKDSASHWYFAGERLLAIDAMNEPRSFMLGKRILESGGSADPDSVADPNVNLKDLLPARTVAMEMHNMWSIQCRQ